MSKIRIALGGSEGNMGKTIQRLVSETDDMGFYVCIDPKNADAYKAVRDMLDNNKILFPEEVVYVDFTTPQTVVDNVREMSEHGMDSVIGTTGWYDRLPEVEEMAQRYGRIIIYPQGNFSIGANAYIWILEKLAEKLGPYDFDAAEIELHHKGKKDSPSGTAEMAANGLLKLPGKTTLTYARSGKDAKRGPEEVDVFGARVGSVTGYHMAVFSPNTGDYERLIVEHNASNRDVFGRPCLDAVRWVYGARQSGMQPGLYEFRRDVLKLV